MTTELPKTTAGEQQSPEEMLKLLDATRDSTMEKLNHHLENLESRSLIPVPEAEGAVRDATQGLLAAKQHLEAMNSLIEFIKHDLILTVMNVGQQGRAVMELAANTKAILKVLVDKDIILKDELKEAWEAIQAQEAQAREQKPLVTQPM